MHRLAFVLVTIFGLGSAVAQPADKKPEEAGHQGARAARAPAMQKPDWSAWKWFLGSWRCSGSVTMGGNEMLVKFTITNKPDLDDWFLVQTARSPRSSAVPVRWAAYLTQDAKGARYVVANSMGVTETGQGPAGWSGDSYELTGQEMSAMGKSDVKHTWKKVSDRELHWSGVATGAAPQTWDWTCKK